MKSKFLATTLILLFACMAGACGESPAEPESPTVAKNTKVEYVSQIDTQGAKHVSVGHAIDVPPVRMTIDNVDIKDSYHFEVTKEMGEETYLRNYDITPAQDHVLFAISGNLTNKTRGQFYPSDRLIKTEFIVDGKAYKGEIHCVDPEKADPITHVDSRDTIHYIVCTDVPSDVAASFANCSLNMGIDDERTEEAMDYIYSIRLK